MNKKQSEGRRLNETKTSLARRGIQIYFYYKTTKKTAQNREKNKVEVKKKSASHGFTQLFSFLGLKLSYVSYYVLQTANMQRQFSFEASPFLHFTLFASTLLRISFEALFLNFNNIYNKIKRYL